ncbi:major facilitator superfamily domain-containing protein 6-B-like isoform X1 [Homarus americanus]|uniref:major facilitator superfamily domain-containing protein 6-B-like isoform X1 n=1 Tax=Homarus americanus TaxID=6706 RepID=UPI001C47F346|nr:major facilitator superfamily domain-containing protein 6-B-like isoform X1 [Homarus americanus]
MGVIDDRLNSSTPRMEVDPEKLVTTFWIYMAVRITFGLFQGMGYTLYEATVMVHVQKTGMDYGFQRAWGIVAVLISSLASGLLVEATGSFSLIFYLSAGLQIVSAGLMLRLTLDFKLPTSSLTKEILKHLCEPEAIMLFLAMLVAGMMGGYAETYMYRYLYNLGGNTVLISLTVTLGAPFECFFMLVTSYFVSLIGHAPLIMIGLFAYVIRLLGMSFLKDPWVVLLLEIVESMANGSLNTVAILYCTVLFSMESIASCRGLLGVMNNGVGRLLGTLLGSIIREALGDRVTFRVLAAGGMVFCVLYCLAFCLLKRYRYKAFSVKTSSLPARQQASRQGATNHACNVDE